jgi:putative hemolysin
MMTNLDTAPSPDKVYIRLANGPEEVAAAQRLRYKVFYEEFNATPDEKTRLSRMDVDEYDAITDHLVVINETLPVGEQIVGTYRLLRRDVAEKYGKFYTSGEFDIQPLLNCGMNPLELGRSCVLAEYRTRPVLQKLWQGIAHYISEHNVELMFGCGSLYGTDIQAMAPQLSYLYHYHLSPPEMRPTALPHRYVEMNLIPKDQLDAKSVFMTLPPLIKGYIRIGATVGLGAVIDHQWNSVDVCIVMPTQLITKKYMKHYLGGENPLTQLEQDLAAEQSVVGQTNNGRKETA